MLAIRLQRVGRTGHAMYRIAVQEAQRHPSSGRIIAYVGTYDPHTKDAKVQVELAQKYLDTGAQPSPRVVKLLSDAGVKLPSWVEKSTNKSKAIRHGEKLRKNRPVVEVSKTAKPAEVAEVAEVSEVEEVAEAEKIEEVEKTADVVEAVEVVEPVESVESAPAK